MAIVSLASVLPQGFGAVLLLVIVQLLQVVGESFPIGKLRRQMFSTAFFEKHFPGAVPKPGPSGYPDIGSASSLQYAHTPLRPLRPPQPAHSLSLPSLFAPRSGTVVMRIS